VWAVHRGVVVCVRRFCLAIHVKAMVCSLCVLFEGTCGWVTGCAWTNFISVTMPSLDMYPTSPGGLFKVPYGVVLENASWSLMLTALAALWLTYVAEDPFAYDDNQKSDRAAVERFFITNAMSYFVGWAWIRELQDLYTILGSMIGQPFGRPVWGQVIVVVFLGPVLTFLLISFKTCLKRRWKRYKANVGGSSGSNTEARADGPGVDPFSHRFGDQREEGNASASSWPVACTCSVEAPQGGSSSGGSGGLGARRGRSCETLTRNNDACVSWAFGTRSSC